MWTLIQYKWYAYKKGKVGDKDAQRKKPCDKKAEMDDASVNQGIPTTVGKSLEARNGAKNCFSTQSSTITNTSTFSLPPTFSRGQLGLQWLLYDPEVSNVITNG